MTPPEAGPPPVLGPLDQVGPQGVPLDVAADGQKMLVALDGEGFETPLVEMAGGMIVGVPAHRVGVGEPADKGGQLAVGPRPEDHVPVIGHQAVGQQADGLSLPGLGQHAFEGRVVLRLLQQRQPGHRPIEDVINQTARSNAGLSRHGREDSIVDDGSQEKESRPLIWSERHRDDCYESGTRRPGSDHNRRWCRHYLGGILLGTMLAESEGVLIIVIGDSAMLWYAIAALAIGLIVINKRFAGNRARALAILNGRPDVDLEQAWARLAAASSFEADHVRRIWYGLANEYGIPAQKLRIEDRLDGELAGLFRHPDHDPFLASLFLSNREATQQYLIGLRTWGEVIVAVRRIELVAHRLATVASIPGQEYSWAD